LCKAKISRKYRPCIVGGGDTEISNRLTRQARNRTIKEKGKPQNKEKKEEVSGQVSVVGENDEVGVTKKPRGRKRLSNKKRGIKVTQGKNRSLCKN